MFAVLDESLPGGWPCIRPIVMKDLKSLAGSPLILFWPCLVASLAPTSLHGPLPSEGTFYLEVYLEMSVLRCG